MNNTLYCLKFSPVFKEKIWGGNRISKILLKDVPFENCGESWEISDIEGEESIVENGFLAENSLPELIEIYMYDLMGEKPYLKFGLGFPLLIKFIDASKNLSIQVHPDDEYALSHFNQLGKNELWYIIDTEPDAKLYIGLKDGVNREALLEAIKKNNIETLLNSYTVTKGEVFYIPAGTIHAIGKGILLAEIQQSSDITFRLYDWNRVDEHGRLRELHIQEALEVIHFDCKEDYLVQYSLTKNESSRIFRSNYFNINSLFFNKPLQKEYHSIDSFVIYICIEGEVHFLKSAGDKEQQQPNRQETTTIVKIRKGDVLLKPAMIEVLNLIPVEPSNLLEIYLP